MNTLLEMKNFKLTFNGPYGRVPAVRGVNLCVKEGETLALVGESGSGKTALCRSILRLHSSHAEIEEGSSLILCDKEIVNKSDEEMVDIRGVDASMIFQDPMSSLNPVYSIGDQIVESMLVHNKSNISKAEAKKQAKDKALALLREVGISNAEIRFKQYPHEFSGGMRQRVAIAIAIACNPKLLIADEPTTSLDTTTQDKIVELLKKITTSDESGASKRGTIFITHDLGIAENIADKIAVMQGGYIVEEGTTDEIFNNPKHEYTKRLLNYANYGKGKGHRHGLVHFHEGIYHSHSATDYENHQHTDISHTNLNEAQDKNKLIEIRSLYKSYQLGKHLSNTVLNDFDLTVYQGEILGLIGDSGCGKSTLARCILNIEKSDQGSIKFNKKINSQMIFQDSAEAFNSRMKIKNIIAEPLLLQYKKQKRRLPANEKIRLVYEVMDQVGLTHDLAERYPYDVSGGQRQRAAIARALITNPDFIIADEPISSLDVSIQAQIIHLLKEIHDKRKLTMIIIAHDLPMVAHISDRIINM